MIREISAGAVIFRKVFRKVSLSHTDNTDVYYYPEYLLLKYHYKTTHWGFVKGNIEKGEDAINTATREAAEEAGISDLTFLPFKRSIHYFYRRDRKLVFKKVIYLLAETKTNRIKLSREHIGYRWAKYDEAIKILTFKEEKTTLKKAHAKLARMGVIETITIQ